MAASSTTPGVAPRTAGSVESLAARAVTRRTLRDSRVRDWCYAYLFAFVAFVQPVAYRHEYPSRLDRIHFAIAFAGNTAIRLFYGIPHDLLTVGGYSAWRVGGILAILAAIWGVLAGVRALRSEEDAGRAELVLAGVLPRRTWFAAALAAPGIAAVGLFVATLIGLVAGSLPVGGAAYLALATLSVAPVYIGVGALASQLAPTRRLALGLGMAVVAVSLLLRVAADTAAGLSALRWLTPLGWAEQLRAFAGPQPAVLVLPLLATAALLGLSARLAVRRDLGAGLLPSRDTAAPRLALLRSPLGLALRSERGSLAGWAVGIGAFAFILGVVSRSVSSAGISLSLQRQFEKLGAGSIVTPKGYLGFAFLFFVLAVSLYCCSAVVAARHEESDERLETLFALPVDRRRWLGGLLGLTVAAAAVLALEAGLGTWLGAVAAGVHISLPSLLGAGLNCLPAALVFLGVAVLAFGLVPRATPAIAYGVVAVSFLWQLFGALLGAPRWLLDASPFEHVGLVPAASFRGADAIGLVAIGLVACSVAVWGFGRRDLAGG